MLGLIKKDILLIIKSISPAYIIAIAAPSVAAFSNRQYFMFVLSITFSFLLAMQVSTTMSLDETVKWRRNVTAMPLTSADEVESKAVITILLGFLSVSFIFLLGIVGSFILKISIVEIEMYCGLGFFLVIIYNAIVIPASYKWGVSTGRYLPMILIIMPIILPYLMRLFKIKVTTSVRDSVDIYFFLICLFILSILILSFSIMISIRILNNMKGSK
ncbi:ABC-2 transporter permease [Hungatella sp.]|uniref:ABC-2 transporter permease n=1 Tax=Hungatella sp. TaxID=2613924 RepID=UPI002A804099|nr:ABC-2 transporter permease [Hungatella sp.]